jgi:hypothetical protein
VCVYVVCVWCVDATDTPVEPIKGVNTGMPTYRHSMGTSAEAFNIKLEVLGDRRSERERERERGRPLSGTKYVSTPAEAFNRELNVLVVFQLRLVVFEEVAYLWSWCCVCVCVCV